MAVGDDTLGELHPVPGIRLGTVSAGIKQPGRPDLVLMALCETANTAVVFTRNAFCAAPVSVAREHLEACEGRPRYLLVNTGNANAGTGQAGMIAAKACTESVASLAGVSGDCVLPFSTGVIGEQLPVGPIQSVRILTPVRDYMRSGRPV